MRELHAALSDVEHDDAVRSVIVTGAGDRIFCAGADLGNVFPGPDVASFIRFGNSVVRRIERFPKPVIAAINGDGRAAVARTPGRAAAASGEVGASGA